MRGLNVQTRSHLIAHTQGHAQERKRPFPKDKQEYRRQEGTRRYASLFILTIQQTKIMQTKIKKILPPNELTPLC